MANTHAFPAEKSRSLLEKLFNKDLPGGAVSRSNKKNEILLPKISIGVYLVKLITVEGTLNKKIMID